jgi:hypothetical protein
MEPFNFGRAFSRTFGLMRDSLASVGLFILIIQLINLALSFAIQQSLMANLKRALESGAAAPTAIFASPLYWLAIVLSTVVGSISMAGSIDGLLKVARGEQTSLGDCFAAGAAKFLPVLGLTILWTLGVMVGWILLIIPGLILITMWSASLPALIGENLGVMESFGRSRELTKGSRLAIFGVLFVSLIIMYVPMIFLGGAVAGGMMGGMMSGMASGMASGTGLGAVFMLVSIPYGWFVGMLISSLLVSIYTETTLIKGGGSTAQLSDVFV